ncbi:MAG: DinB family protein [Chloroflexota bacterium]|nr:DinB family protein [Chloroflexota bacterium]
MALDTPNVFIFPRNEPGTTGHLDLVEPLRALPGDLRDALAQISEAEALYRPAPGQPDAAPAWCIKEIVGHLRDAAEVDHKRLYMMSTQTDPVLQPWDQDAYARDHAYLSRPLDDMLRELEDQRAQTVFLLTTLVNWNWARTGQHLERGRVSIRQMVEHMVEHEAQHLADVRALRAAAVARGT